MSRNESNLGDRLSEALLVTDSISQAIIEIEQTDGIVTLQGTVESQEDRWAAEVLVRQQEGVVDVINNLCILDR